MDDFNKTSTWGKIHGIRSTCKEDMAPYSEGQVFESSTLELNPYAVANFITHSGNGPLGEKHEHAECFCVTTIVTNPCFVHFLCLPNDEWKKLSTPDLVKRLEQTPRMNLGTYYVCPPGHTCTLYNCMSRTSPPISRYRYYPSDILDSNE